VTTLDAILMAICAPYSDFVEGGGECICKQQIAHAHVFRNGKHVDGPNCAVFIR